MFLRDLVTRLLYRKQWRDFASPVDDDQLPYSKKVKEPMDLSTRWGVEKQAYATMDAFFKDVHLMRRPRRPTGAAGAGTTRG